MSIHVYWPKNATIVLLTDTRMTDDWQRDTETLPAPNASSVFRHWKFGKAVWGHKWPTVARVALFNPTEKVTPAARTAAKKELAALLSSKRPGLIVVLQTMSKSARKVFNEDEAKSDHDGTICWDFFGPPGTIADCAGTYLSTQYGTVLPVLNPRNGDYVYGNPIGTWLQWARDGVRPAAHYPWYIAPGPSMQQALQGILYSAKQGWPITLDIENFTGTNLITVLGLTDGNAAVAIPWHAFTPHGQSYTEPGCEHGAEGDLARDVLFHAKTVIGHNHIDHDLPLLESIGVSIPGRPFDTYLAHGVFMNQLRHGLQQCCSYFFPTDPWKEAYRKAQGERTGADKDTPEFWLQCPNELRTYNCGDLENNHKLAEHLWFPVLGKKFGEW